MLASRSMSSSLYASSSLPFIITTGRAPAPWPAISMLSCAPSSSCAGTAAASSAAPAASSSTMPSFCAIAIAVSGWSPVIITTRMPASLHSSIAPFTSSRGGSISPIRPRNTRSRSWSASFWSAPPFTYAPGCIGLNASASTRSPRDAICSASSSILCTCFSDIAGMLPSLLSFLPHFATRLSGAPFDKRISSCLLSFFSVDVVVVVVVVVVVEDALSSAAGAGE